MKRIVWTDPAKADVRGLDKPTAMRIPHALHRFFESGEGDVKALQGRDEPLLRLQAILCQHRRCPSKSGASSIAVKPTDERVGPTEDRIYASRAV